MPAEPFLLEADPGFRFCLYHSPQSAEHCRGALIYVHPFCDEMNKSRRMAAMQAQVLAKMGFGVLQIDLYGCGDSSGEFGDARWEIWKRDLATARNWLVNHVSAPVSLWGLRLGALLALDFARSQQNPFHSMILWQPIVSGESFLNQFLRLRVANEMLTRTGDRAASGTTAMRQYLAEGKSLEVAGYELAPDLAAAIDDLKASELVVKGCVIHWFEIISEPGRSMTPGGAKVITEWGRNGADTRVHLVSCTPFWATQEISECPDLIATTVQAFE